MKEKKRYEIHIYDDICIDLYDNGVLDKSINDTYKLEELLNQQSKRIKELEEELDDAKRDYIPKLEFGLQRANKMLRDSEKENQQLKQQLVLSEKKSDEILLNYKTKKYGLDKTIQELRKTKLSLPEKEWYYKGFENCERQMSSYIADLTQEVKELKQQLAEKDAEIASYRKNKL